MKKLFTVFFILLYQWNLAFALISLEEEEKIGRQVLQEISKKLELINDVEAQSYVNILGEILATKGVSFSPFQFRFYLLKDKTFNAFSVPGGYIFLNSGIFEYAETESELASILAHEMSHNLARHVAKRIETIRNMQIATTAATLAAILLGGGQAGQIVGLTGTAIAQTKLLAYSRKDEEEADRLAFEILTKAGFNPQGMVNMFRKLSQKSSFAIELNYRYLLTHPLPQERLNYLQALSEKYSFPYKNDYPVSEDPIYFKRLKIRIKVLSEDASDLIINFRSKLRENVDPWLSYALAMALLKKRFFTEAENTLLEAIKTLPQKDYFILDLGELYFHWGKYERALNIFQSINFSGHKLEKLLELKRKYLLARSLMEVGALKESYQLFINLSEEKLMQQEPSFYYYFGLLCTRMKKTGEAHFYFGKSYEIKGDFKTALFHYKRALPFLEKDTKIYTEAESKVKTLEEKSEKRQN